MPLTVWGFEIRRAGADVEERENIPSIIPQVNEDGAQVVPAGGTQGYLLDLEGAVRTESELIARYRDTALHPEVESAIDDITNEAIVTDTEDPTVQLDLSLVEIDDNLKGLIEGEWDRIQDLLCFNTKAYEIFKQWYIDGRSYYQMIINEDAPQDGIQALRPIDAMHLRKVREVHTERDNDGFNEIHIVNEYYVYSENGFRNNAHVPVMGGAMGLTNDSIRISKDSVVHVTSGLQDQMSRMVLSHVHAAIKPLNQLRSLEDATIVYRLVRAPERKVFNVEVGGMPPAKANQFLHAQMQKHKNKTVYDQTTGEVRDDRKFMTMIEDYWFPTSDGKGTKVDILKGGDNLGEMTDVEYFQQKLYKALYVPISRLESSDGFSIGRPSEITRDELKFMKFVARLRMQFSQLFFKLLRTQLLLRQIIAPDEWHMLEQKIRFKFTEDNFFEELKKNEVLREQMTTLGQVDAYVGKYVDDLWVYQTIFHFTDDQTREMQERVDAYNQRMIGMQAQEAELMAKAQAAGDPR